MTTNKTVKATSFMPFWIESIDKDGKQFPIDVISVQRNSNNTLYIERSQFDIKKDKYLPKETYVLKRTTENKIGNIARKLNEIKREVLDLI